MASSESASQWISDDGPIGGHQRPMHEISKHQYNHAPVVLDSSGTSRQYDVFWSPSDHDESWNDAESEIQQLGISRWRLWRIGRGASRSGLFEWRLEVTVTGGHVWSFRDESGVERSVTTFFANRDYSVDFNSVNPTILYVRKHVNKGL